MPLLKLKPNLTMKETLKNIEQVGYTIPDSSIHDTAPKMNVHIIPGNTYSNSYKTPAKRSTILKRSLDISISLIVIIFILPWLFLFIGIVVKFESKGPILFKQLRSGKNNKLFWCYKFRTMVVND